MGGARSVRRRARPRAVLAPVAPLSSAIRAAATTLGHHRPDLPGTPARRTRRDGDRQACSASDDAVTQYSGASPVVVPGSSTMTLTQLGAAAAQWSQIQFLDRPVNQSGCTGATLTPAYAGSGRGS